MPDDRRMLRIGPVAAFVLLSLAMIVLLGAWPFVLLYVAVCFMVAGVRLIVESRKRD